MPKLQLKSNGQITMTIPSSKAKAKGWKQKLENGEDVEVDVGYGPDGDLLVKEIDG